MAESADRLALAEKIDPELLQMLARMPRRQQRQVLSPDGRGEPPLRDDAGVSEKI
jgi:hypothetical protein